VIFADIVRSQVAASKSVLVFAHRREIISQTGGKLHALCVSHGIIQAGFSPRPLERVQVASIQTLHRRAIHTDSMLLPPADLLIVDEAHHATAATYRAIINAYPDAICSAHRRCRGGDGRGPGGIELIIECRKSELIKRSGQDQNLSLINPDLKGARVEKGDYVEAHPVERRTAETIGDRVTAQI
jgi:hypothetical protein